jgi:hypothetical protein
MKELIAAAFLFSTVAGSGVANALPLLPVQAPSVEVIQVAGGAAPAGIGDPMAAAGRITPTPPHTRVRAATTSGRAAAAAATADRFSITDQ